jgi:hypothetical protein
MMMIIIQFNSLFFNVLKSRANVNYRVSTNTNNNNKTTQDKKQKTDNKIIIIITTKSSYHLEVRT